MRGVRDWLAHKWYLYELWTGLYMLDPLEKFFFNSIIVVITFLSFYYGSRHAEFHEHFIQFMRSAVRMLKGEAGQEAAQETPKPDL